MSTTSQCPECGAPLPSAGAACPRCLLAAGLTASGRPKLGPGFLDDLPVSGGDARSLSDHGQKEFIGRYKILEKIGEGGCGVVYVAEQQEPVRRRVALKVIKLGMDTRSVVARFEAERQALALMDHPNIAKVLDGGATETGRPFFVMELVRGIKITDYCDQNNLSTEERLKLFIQVCHAIQHAHQKGIIHRDIKPSNILVTLHDGVPVPKVIDFGIAKATTDQRLTDKTVYTALEQFVGTPAYMSPEQAERSGLDIDTRSDTYALGVLLYELLTGYTPFDAKTLQQAGLDQMRRIIREQEPARPSTRLSTMTNADLNAVATRRRSEPPKLIHLVRGDLDWIVMKCLEKDRTRRYETANGLAADLQRHLSNEPVTARPPSTAYRFQKLLRRNKVMSAATALVLTAILVGTVISIEQTLRARSELRRALAAEANAQAALHFIQDDVLSQASPGYQADRDLKVRVLLDRVADRLDHTTNCPPPVEASIRQTIGSVYTELGDYLKAIKHYEVALQLQRQHLGESHPDTLRSLCGLVMACWWTGDMVRAGTNACHGLEASRRVLGEKDPLTLQFMEAQYFTQMNLGETPWTKLEPLYLQALTLHREVLGANDLGTLRLVYGLGIGYFLNWQDAKAEPLVVDALERSRDVLGENHPQTADLTALLAVEYSRLNQLDKAEALARDCVRMRDTILGKEHPLSIGSDLMLAWILAQQERFDEAEQLTQKALNLSKQLPIENTMFFANHLSRLGWILLEHDRIDQANTLCERAWQTLTNKPDANPMAKPLIVTYLGAIRLAQQNYTAAEPLLREGLKLAEKHWPDEAYRFYVMNLLGASLSGQKNYADAEPLLLQSCKGLQDRRYSMTPSLNANRRITESFERLVQLYDAWAKPVQAAEWRRKLAEFEKTAE